MTDEVDLSKMDCKIFVDGASSPAELSNALAEIIGGTADEASVTASGIELLVSTNDFANEGDKADQEEGFLYYDLFVEVYFAPSVEHQRRVTEVSKVLEGLWNRDLDAVAAADYEDELPKQAVVAVVKVLELAAGPSPDPERLAERLGLVKADQQALRDLVTDIQAVAQAIKAGDHDTARARLEARGMSLLQGLDVNDASDLGPRIDELIARLEQSTGEQERRQEQYRRDARSAIADSLREAGIKPLNE